MSSRQGSGVTLSPLPSAYRGRRCLGRRQGALGAMSALAEAALAASREADADAAEVARAAAVAAAVSERKKLMLAEAVALGREAIGTLPYFDDLGLASDEAFLSALGRCVALRERAAALAGSARPPRG